MLQLSIVFLVIIFSISGYCQSKSESKMEFFAEAGTLLPDQINGLEDTMGMWSLGTGLSSNNKSYFLQYATGSGDEGVSVMDVSLGVRKDLVLSGVAATLGGGVDLLSIDRPTSEGKTYYGGAHFSAGLMALISKGLYARMNMKFNGNPGISMFLSFGLLYRPSEDI